MAKKNNLLIANYYHLFIVTWRADEGMLKLMISCAYGIVAIFLERFWQGFIKSSRHNVVSVVVSVVIKMFMPLSPLIPFLGLS